MWVLLFTLASDTVWTPEGGTQTWDAYRYRQSQEYEQITKEIIYDNKVKDLQNQIDELRKESWK